MLSRSMRPGSWVAVSLRGPTAAETKRTRLWFRHRRDGLSATHYSLDANALIATYSAGAQTQSEVAALLTQVVSITPGFDLEAAPYTGQRAVPRVLALAVGPAAFAAMWWGAHAKEIAGFSHLTYSAVAGVAALVLGLIASAVPASGYRADRALRESLVHSTFPAPLKRRLVARRPVRKTTTDKDGVTRHIERSGDYPLSPAAFLLGPAMVTGLASPHTGVTATVADTAYRSVPTALLDDIGPLVAYGESPGGERGRVGVHLSAAELYGGVAALGQPGTGKTTLLHNLFGWSTLERVSPSGRPGYPGRNNTLVCFESKGEGTSVYESWSDAYGDEIWIVEVADPETPALHVADPLTPPKERASAFVDAMKYSWDDSAIQGLSTETLSAVFTAAMTIMEYAPNVADATRSLTDAEPSFVSIAHLLLGGGCSYEDARQIATNLSATYQDRPDDSPDKPFLSIAVRSLNTLFGPDMTTAKWSNAVNASRNKVDVLMGAPSWWSPARSRGSWRDALVNHSSVVINSGVSRSGLLLNAEVGSVIASMTAFALKRAIEQNCSRWESQQRYVSIFADEIGVLTKSSSEVIEWWRAQGRSYGVRAFLAAQWPDQLGDSVRASFLSSTNMFWFQQTNPRVIADAVAQLNVNVADQSESRWSSWDIGNLRKYQAIMHATSDGRLQSPTAVDMAFWTDKQQFAIDQGWRS